MRHRWRRGRCRRGATAVEMAIIGPLVLLFVMGLMVAILGVFRLQQLGRLAHEAARWASVRGDEWAELTHNAPITADDVYRNAVLPLAQTLNTDHLACEVQWNEGRTLVQVTLRYQWLPECFLVGQVVTATSVRPVSI
jgi:Flp pilus assembly protein TadG